MRLWVVMCALLLGVTWGPLLGVHLHRTSLSDADAGPMVVVFPPTLSVVTLFDRVIAANGALVRPVNGLRNTWIVQSPEPGFVGRLKQRGAWAAFSLDLLSAKALFDCLRPAPPRDPPA